MTGKTFACTIIYLISIQSIYGYSIPSLDIPTSPAPPAYGKSWATEKFGLDVPVVQPVVVIESALMVGEAPEFEAKCRSEPATTGVFYLAHPTDSTLFIQCDESGKAFVKQCPSGTWFTKAMTCGAMTTVLTTPSSSSSSVSLDVSAVSSSTVMIVEATKVSEAPEFDSYCRDSKMTGIWYLMHPTDSRLFIQCDESYKAYIMRCPEGTWFTSAMTCEGATIVVPPAVETKKPEDFTSKVAEAILVGEAPEYESYCKPEAFKSGSFYIMHPTDNSLFIQCDEHGKAFIKRCPIGTWFTSSMTCEAMNTVVITPALDMPVSGYETPKVILSQLELVSESSEFESYCRDSKMTGVWYLMHPTDRTLFIQCDESYKAFVRRCPTGTVFLKSMACGIETITVPALDMPVSGYETPKIVLSQLELVSVAPEFDSYCRDSKMTGVWYIMHPTDSSLFIQCDESYKAYVRRCPSGTVFLKSMTCGIEQVQVPALDISVSGYETPKVVLSQLELVSEAPEFDSYCRDSKMTGVFYLMHPTDSSLFIQCDESYKAYVRRCPSGTVFLKSMTCGKFESVVIPSLDAPVSGFTSNMIIDQAILISESSEYEKLCREQPSRSGVFYLMHPTNNFLFIQCDQYGKAFVMRCPVGTWFTKAMTCEAMTAVATPSLDMTVSGFEAPKVVLSELDYVGEAPEFDSYCKGSKMTGVFYLMHPTDSSLFIQCDDTYKAYVRRCPTGTVFLKSMTCVRSEVTSTEIVLTPVVEVPVTTYATTTVFVPPPPPSFDVPVVKY